MIQLHNFFRIKVSRIFPPRPLSLDCLEVGREFRVCSVESRPILRMLLYHGISENPKLRVIGRGQYWISIGEVEGSQSINLSRPQARYILVRKA